MNNLQLDAIAWKSWCNGSASDQSILQWQAVLAARIPELPTELLDPRLLPIALLDAPEKWSPETSGLDASNLLASHTHLEHPSRLLSCGLLSAIGLGEASLYSDLPPVHLQAYLDGLRPMVKKTTESALEHLASVGRQRFRIGLPLHKDLDRYQPPEPDPIPIETTPTSNSILIVIHSTQDEADTYINLSLDTWSQTWHRSLDNLSNLLSNAETNDDALISFCHINDQIDPHACRRISEFASLHSDAVLFTSDETLRWSSNPNVAAGNRQCRTAITPLRLICRGCLGGLVTFRYAVLRSLELPDQTLSLHAFLLDLALQVCAQKQPVAHCPEVLLHRSQDDNPNVPDVASPADRTRWSPSMLAEILAITRQRGEVLLEQGGQIEPIKYLGACHKLQLQNKSEILISILIPFRDRVKLTQSCVNSLRRFAGPIPYEIVLIDNGSNEIATHIWLKQLSLQANITVVNVDGPFNYSKINNVGRSHAKGNYLLFLNNDIEFRSENFLDDLLDPFAFQATKAVGMRLKYPNGSVQHQGVILVKGERRCVAEPGKHLNSPNILATFTPLQVQEEFIAATGACLMVRSEDFDCVGGFDENLAVVFNDVDLCLRLREAGGSIVVSPFVDIIHHESISRGKDQSGEALARHQRESGYLRSKHAVLFANGDPLTSQLIHPHSNRYQPRESPPRSDGLVQSAVLLHWRNPTFKPSPQRPILLLAHYSKNNKIREDLFMLLDEYARHADVILISSACGLRRHPRTLKRLRQRCVAIIVRRNKGYDFGSWKSGLSLYQTEIKQSAYLILTNDSLWGPITPLDNLFQEIQQSSADCIGLTDDLMYEPHLSSAFTAYKTKAINHKAFKAFWDKLENWPRKRDLIKQCEVGLSVCLRKADLQLESIYTKNANGSVLHYDWKKLIEKNNFPFLKVSLLRDNPTQQPVDGWSKVVGERNPELAITIQRQLRKTRGIKNWLQSLPNLVRKCLL